MAHNNGNKATLTSNLDKCENQNESGREDEESEFQTTPLHNIYIYILFFSRKKEWFQLLGICFYFILGSNNSWNALLPKYILQVQKTFSKKSSLSQRISTEKEKKRPPNPPARDPRATSTGNSKSNGKSKAMTRKGRDSVEPLADPRGVSIQTTWRMGFHDLESRG